jgi:hypothetical protein
MKKLFIIIAAAVLFMTSTANLSAQNYCALKNAHGSQSIFSYSDDMKAFQRDDHTVTIVPNVLTPVETKATATTHTLTVYPPLDGSWDYLAVTDGTDRVGMLWQGQADQLTLDLEEGTYQVLSGGCFFTNVSFYDCIWVSEMIVLNDDVEVQVDYNDCVYNVNVDLVDENGNSFAGLNFYNLTYQITFDWFDGVWTTTTGALADGYMQHILNVKYNGFDENSTVNLAVMMEPGNQKSYFFKGSTRGMHESPTFVVAADDLTVIQEHFMLNGGIESPCFYHNDIKSVFDPKGNWLVNEGWIPELTFDQSMPYTVVSNARVDNSSSFESGSKILLMPTVFEGYDQNNNNYPRYKDYITTPLYIDSEGNVVREAKPFFREGENLASWPNYFPKTPARMIQSEGKTTYFGERTPLATYYPVAFNANNTPLGRTFFSGGFFFSGEHSCERSCDYDSYIHIIVNGQELYNDSIYRFNFDDDDYYIEPSNVIVEVNNEHLTANEVSKANTTHAEFNLERDDAMPPTMTFLRVLDDKGDENIWLDKLSQSTLVFGCGDFTHHFSEEGNRYDHLLYDAKPDVEVLYSLDGDDWLPLFFTEDESLFHVDYGNVFVADLSQMEIRVLDKWVSLKFSLIDEAGNTQTQTLENVFFAGEQTNVNEQSNLSHSVYPNPFTGEVRITTAQGVNGIADVQVYNVLGELVYGKIMNCTETMEFNIDGGVWKSGVYFYSIITDQGRLHGRIVKE